MQRHVTISAPDFDVATFKIRGTAPLVVHRFSQKAKTGMIQGMCLGTPGRNTRKNRDKLNPEANYQQARYISRDGWDGFNAAGLRAAAISACRLVGFKMVLAKLSIFVIADGVDATEPEYQLIRIYGEPRMLESVGRLATGQVIPIFRPCYDDWRATIRIRYDRQQFTLKDITNLISRVGMQVGLGEGRPDSKNSPGMGWGTFELES